MQYILLAWVLTVGACSSDFKWGTRLQKGPLLPSPDISISIVDDSTLVIQWEKPFVIPGEDNQFQYKVVMATEDPEPINNIEKANSVAEPYLLADWQDDISEFTFDAVDAGVTYYFAVLVQDSHGHISMYTIKSFIHSNGKPILLSGNYLKSPLPHNTQYMGWNVATDGDLLAVCCPGDSLPLKGIYNDYELEHDGKNFLSEMMHTGSVSIFRKAGQDQWLHEAYIKPPNPGRDLRFCTSVAISGDTLVIGAPNENSHSSNIIHDDDLKVLENTYSINNIKIGAAYVYRRKDKKWNFEAYLKAPNPHNQAKFGFTVAIEENTIAIGAPGDKSPSNSIIHGDDLSALTLHDTDVGAVHIYSRGNHNKWKYEAYLKAPNADTASEFGYALDISKNTIMVGAPHEKSNTTSVINGDDLSATNMLAYMTGAAYIFTKSGKTWSHQAYLKAPFWSHSLVFGSSVAIDGDIAAVGLPGDKHTQNSIINDGDFSSLTKHATDLYGAAVTYTRNSAGIWTIESFIKTPNNQPYASFGISMDLKDNILAVSATSDSNISTKSLKGDKVTGTNTDGFNIGAVHVFERTKRGWQHTHYLKAPNTATEALNFGLGVAITPDHNILIGAPLESSNTPYGTPMYENNENRLISAGAAYYFPLSKQ